MYSYFNGCSQILDIFYKICISIKSKHLGVVKSSLNVETGGVTPTNSHNVVINRLLDFSEQIFPVC